jgi:Icc-related predicted phosphoesterase
MKVLNISDTHGMHKYWERLFPIPKDIDMIIHGGDLTNVGAIHEMNHFMYWIKNLDIEHKIIIAGNHDLGLDNFNRYTLLDMIQDSDVHYLEDSGVEIEGIKFWGSPVTPPFMNWAFMRDEERIIKHWDGIPNDTDFLITHGPALGILDWVDYGGQGSVGSAYLLETIQERVKPKYHMFGHIHEMYGIREVGETIHICASILDGRYHPTRAGHIIDL